MDKHHSLLRRQLKRLALGEELIPDEWRRFVQMVDEAYAGFDDDRAMLERSLDLSSQELLQANAEVRAVLRAFPDLFIWLDREDRILNLQTGDDRYLYLPAARMIGKTVRDIPDPEVAARFGAACETVRSTARNATIEYELTVSKEKRQFEARLLPLVMGQVIVIIRDITTMKKAEDERLRSSKLESVGLLAGGIAHDFNNILTAILANVSIASDSIDRDSEVGVCLRETEQAAHRAAALTQQLLTFSRGGSPITAAASASDLIRQSAVFALRGSNVRSVFDIAEGLHPVQVDEGQIHQVINNLIINADQSMPDGGVVTIVARNIECDGIEPTLPATHCVSIAITDEGSGIEPEHLNKIFDPYFTTKPHGSGLGLASSYAIIRKHHGEIMVNSAPGTGTTMTVLLPAADGAPQADHAPRVEVVEGLGRVLIMDDEVQILKVASTMLNGLGYDVETVADGESAVRAYVDAMSSGSKFDAVIMDLTIPGGVGGAEATRQLRAIDPGLVAIASSGYSNDPVMANYRQHGFDAILAKPYDLRQISRAVAGVLNA